MDSKAVLKMDNRLISFWKVGDWAEANEIESNIKIGI
tara:strand:+ start:90 stop:200 length:111 start_codon:yes stop_codon:yes gene_type:complete